MGQLHASAGQEKLKVMNGSVLGEAPGIYRASIGSCLYCQPWIPLKTSRIISELWCPYLYRRSVG